MICHYCDTHPADFCCYKCNLPTCDDCYASHGEPPPCKECESRNAAGHRVETAQLLREAAAAQATKEAARLRYHSPEAVAKRKATQLAKAEEKRERQARVAEGVGKVVAERFGRFF